MVPQKQLQKPLLYFISRFVSEVTLSSLSRDLNDPKGLNASSVCSSEIIFRDNYSLFGLELYTSSINYTRFSYLIIFHEGKVVKTTPNHSGNETVQ